MFDRFMAHWKAIVLLSFAAVIVGWGAVTLVATTSPVISGAAGAVVLGCGLIWLFVQRSRAAHDREIAATYPSFGPALERRRAEGRAA
jgi:Flp pilus assembly protein TadB